ncbi:hypothetical protein [Lachnobacterium bovis]|uniref:hypothetical protein n=1 Tax=Lachnobacterium bovis TaxID=140626 RepID=UPI000480B250|nr:hypothetical protein [Lachnobacterium bovis]
MTLSYDDDYVSKTGKSAVAFTPQVTISESEIAEPEKPKVKEVKPKDIEVYWSTFLVTSRTDKLAKP